MAQEDSGIQLLLGILSATGGALGAIALRELIQWARRPKLQLTLDLSAMKLWNVSESGFIRHETKYVRLTVHNNGKTVARHCEAKIEPMDDKGNSLFDPSIL